MRNELRYKLTAAGVAALMGAAAACTASGTGEAQERYAGLRHELQAIADGSSGEVGIAVITDRGDTIVVNNETKYPLMSVFKLHQAIALCHDFERRGAGIDSVVSIPRRELNPHTWSPMLKDYSDSVISIAVDELLRYTLTQSDNNASNYLFDKMTSVTETDSFIATTVPRSSFQLRATEAEMWNDHSLCYENRSSPLGAALLMNRLFTDSIVGGANADFIGTTLQECRTGSDRIAAPLAGLEGVRIAHKTGSGFRGEDGTLSAHNDVAHVMLPDNRYYTIAVLVKDFHGSESEAASVIARVSETVYCKLKDVK